MSGTYRHEEYIETCERCGGKLRADLPGCYKSPSEIFVHKVCFEEGEPGDPVLDLSDEHPFKEHVPIQYQCGHYADGPPRHLPEECPECEVPAP